MVMISLVLELLVGGWCVDVVCCMVLDSAVCGGTEGAGRGKDTVGIFSGKLECNYFLLKTEQVKCCTAQHRTQNQKKTTK